jgi:hypothetical protein
MRIGVLSCVFYMLLSVFLSLPSRSFAQIPIHEKLLEPISFLYPYSIINGKREVSAGTGFMVKQDSGLSFLVTAKHVLMHKSGDYYQKLCIRHSTKNGADFIPVTLSGSGAARVLTHQTDSNVDIAVIPGMDIPLPIGKPVELWLGTSLATSLFATKEHFAQGDVRLGDEVFFVGWFSAYFGRERNYPIVRFGRLSFLPNKEVPFYLIEAWATSGNSGSPAFFRPSLQREPGTFVPNKPSLLLAGVLHGFLGARPLRNAGIAAVVPAFQLDEVLTSNNTKQLKPLPGRMPPPGQKDIAVCREVEEEIVKGGKL